MRQKAVLPLTGWISPKHRSAVEFRREDRTNCTVPVVLSEMATLRQRR